MVELEKLAFIRSISRHVGVDADALIHRLPLGSCGMAQETEEGMDVAEPPKKSGPRAPIDVSTDLR